ncbi:hypothetical protein IWX90DRAFT_420756 [Phyllosticta citrichinensis]|uniref:Uncharacterized protein n=1 Tax=Phyllosticta citrichinensis TaxID=1130410 RepID=A0ABR1Y6V2_9PEZI
MAIFLRGRRLPSSSSSSCCFAPAEAIRVSDRFCPSRRDGHGSLPLDCLVCWLALDTHPVGLTTPLAAVEEQTGDGTEILSLPDTLKDGPFRANCPVMPSLVCPGNGTYGSNLIVSHHQGRVFFSMLRVRLFSHIIAIVVIVRLPTCPICWATELPTNLCCHPTLMLTCLTPRLRNIIITRS